MSTDETSSDQVSSAASSGVVSEGSRTVALAGEDAIIAAIQRGLGSGPEAPAGIGDDAAVVPASGPYVMTTDMMIGGRDWLAHWSTPEQVGARLAAQNLADVAAMGAKTSAAVLTLGLPPSTTIDWVESFARGLGQCVRDAGGYVVGGDLAGSDELIVSLTVTGDLGGASAVTRSGAHPGDVLALAGTLGRSYCGLDLCHAGFALPSSWGQIPVEFREAAIECIDVFKAAKPPLQAGPQAARAGATSMLDLSDGLARDGRRIACASGVALRLDEDALRPYIEFLQPMADLIGKDALEWVLAGGEDHSLLATFPAGTRLPDSFAPLGTVEVGEPQLWLSGLPATAHVSWDHFE